MDKIACLFILLLITFFTWTTCGVQAEVPPSGSVRILASLDLDSRSVSGTLFVTVPDQGIELVLPACSEISYLKVDGRGDKALVAEAGSRGRERTLYIPRKWAGKMVEIGFVSTFSNGKESVAGLGRQEFLGDLYWGKDSVMLLAPWSPIVKGRAVYELEVMVPEGFTAMSEADYVIETGETTRCFTFVYGHDREFPTLVAGKFFVFSKEMAQGIGLHVYLLRQDPGLADQYLAEMERFIELYSDLIGPYPFRRFAVVANSAQTGFGLPTYTLIGDRLMGLPFIREISLGHEILHSWFGNCVRVDYSRGNWCEGLTTYLADHYYSELKGEGAKWRHDALAEFEAYVHGEHDRPLSSFTHRSDRPSKAVGYEKAAMVFHMLRRMGGDGPFFDALGRLYREHRFSPVSWQEIRSTFEKVYGKRLDWFFGQWLERKGLPRLEFSQGVLRQSNSGFVLEVKVRQLLHEGETPWRISLPFIVVSQDGPKNIELFLDEEEKTLTLELDERPLSVFFDPEYQIARRLSEPEMPPMIATLIGDGERYVVIGDGADKEVFEKAAQFFSRSGFELVTQDEIKHNMVKKGSFLVLGEPKGRLAAMVPRVKPSPGSKVTIAVRKNMASPSHVVAAVEASDPDLLKRVMAKVPHYGKYALLEFGAGARLIKKVKGSYVEGINVDFQPQILGVASSSLRDASAIYQQLEPFRVIYLGETHTDAGFHQVQFEVVKYLHERGRPIAVGFEMFQLPFQGVIDDYLAGKIDEREFLKKTEYFERWRYNYRFYRPIVEYCRANGIPIVALNLPAEVSKKIARQGLDALDQEERRWLPEGLDMSNRAYRYHMQEVFSQHDDGTIEDFEHFFQAQIAWDETMAASIVRYLRQNPERSMVVIVGSGHVAYRFGIPSRVERNGITPQTVVLSGREKVLDPDEADFFLFPPVLPEPFSAKLGVLLSKDEILKVEKVVKGSPADLAGVKEGDVITAIDGVEVANLDDLRLELFFKEKGDTVTIEVERSDDKGKIKRLALVSGPLEEVDFSGVMGMGGFHGGKMMTMPAGHPKVHDDDAENRDDDHDD